jgi:hypothetical protein
VDDLVANGDVASGKITRSVTSNNGASSVGIGSCGGAIAYLASSGDGGKFGVNNGGRGIDVSIDITSRNYRACLIG